MIKLNIQRFGSTNKTTHYELSQFVSSDKPSWLNDINSDMAKIDTAINTAKTTADGAATAAGNAATAAEGAQNTANTAVTNAATADGKAVQAQTDIGTLANLTTTAKTNLVSAINEVDDEVGNLIVNSQSNLTNKAYSCDYVNTEIAKRELKPEILYSNDNGTTTSVTINKNINNYDYLLFETEIGVVEIFTKRIGTGGQTVLSKTYYGDRLYHQYILYNVVDNSGTSFTISINNSGAYYDGANHVVNYKLYKVEGYTTE